MDPDSNNTSTRIKYITEIVEILKTVDQTKPTPIFNNITSAFELHNINFEFLNHPLHKYYRFKLNMLNITLLKSNISTEKVKIVLENVRNEN